MRFIALSSLLALAACGLTTPPQIFAFDYAIRPNDPALRAAVASGAVDIETALGPAPCSVIVSYAGPDDPRVRQAGSPGDAGYNVTIFATNPVNASSRNPAACAGDAISEVAITVGGPGTLLDVGDTTTTGNLRIVVNGEAFDTSVGTSHFAARLTGPVPGGDPAYAGADFEAVARAPGSGANMIVIDGAFAAR